MPATGWNSLIPTAGFHKVRPNTWRAGFKGRIVRGARCLSLTVDPAFAEREWNGAVLMKVLEEFEARMKQKPAVSLGRMSPYPRVLSLREILKTLS